MALAYNVVQKIPLSHKTIVDVTLDTAYPANGYLLSPTGLGVLGTPMVVDAQFITGQGFSTEYQATGAQAGKLKLFKNAAGAGQYTECASADITASMVVRCEVQANPLSSVIV